MDSQPDRQLWLPLVVKGELGECDLSAENPTEAWGLMERITAPENLRAAYGRVISNKGAPWIDGMTVEALGAHLQAQWPAIRERLLAGAYRPAAVRRHELPKPGGGIRVLGLEKFFDRVNHDKLMGLVEARVPDWRVRRLIRCFLWKQWGSRGYRELRKRGVSCDLAWNTSKSAHGPWRISRSPALGIALPTRIFDTHFR